jgi:hypothetical protein
MSAKPRPIPGASATVLRVLATCGYGLWMLLGLGLALGVYSNGRGQSLVPLVLGMLFVGAGPLLASLRLRRMAGWNGWRLDAGARPTREALLAMLAFLPMLGVAALARGENDFWATRLLGAALAGCSLACLVYGAAGVSGERLRAHVGLPPVTRVVTACYGGGLWLLLCVIAQDPASRVGSTGMWVIGLLLLALLHGLVEGMRWQTLRSLAQGWARRFLAAVLTYAVPCLGLLLTSRHDDPLWTVLLAAVGCVAGRSIELRLYETLQGRRRAGAPADPGMNGRP